MPKKLLQLEAIARLKADRELKKFAAFSALMRTAQENVTARQIALQQSYDANAPLTVAEARMASAQSARSARELSRAKGEIARLQPRFDKVRSEAARELGRAEVLSQLARTASNRRLPD